MVKIRKVTIKNLFSYRNKTEINFDEKNVIVGPNNAGKSSIFKSIKFMLDCLTTFNREQIKPWNNSLAQDALISLDLQLSDLVERNFLLDLLCVRPYDRNRDSFKLLDFEQRSVLLDKIKEVTLTVVWDINDYYDTRRNFKFCLKIPSLGFEIASRGFGSSTFAHVNSEEKSIYGTVLFDILNSIDYSNSPEEVIKKKFPSGSKTTIEVCIIPSPNQFSDEESNHVLYSPTKVRLDRIFLTSGISPQQGQQYSLSLLFSNMLRRRITLISERRNFNDSEELVYDDLSEDGGNLQTFLFWLSQSEKPEDKWRFNKIKELFEKVMSSQNLSFDIITTKKVLEDKEHYDLSSKTLVPDKARVVFMETSEKEKNQFDFNAVGAGVRECLFLITKCLTAEHNVIIMDEPALHLHPLQIRSLMREIFALNKEDSNLSQIIIITHSASIASLDILADANQIIRIKKIKGSSRIIQPDNEQRKWLIDNLPTFHLLRPDVLFAKSTILVEGPSDRIFLETLLNQADNLKIPSDTIHILDVGGKKSFTKFQKFLKMFEIPYLILADNDVQDRFEVSTFNLIDDTLIVDEKKGIYVLKVKDLEAYLAKLNQELYNDISSKYDRKQEVAYHFIKQLLQEELPTGIKPILSLMEAASKLD